MISFVNDIVQTITVFAYYLIFCSPCQSILKVPCDKILAIIRKKSKAVTVFTILWERLRKAESSYYHRLNPQESRKGTRREGFPMAPKRKPARGAAAAEERDPDGMFRGVSAFIVPHGVQPRRLEVALCPRDSPLCSRWGSPTVRAA
jgi:hypothetical protein